MKIFEGEFIRIAYVHEGGGARIVAIEPHPQTYLRAGADHLVRDVHALLGALNASGVHPVTATPDRSATRLTLEEAGFRGEGEMSYSPESPVPVPSLDAGRPGGFGPDTRVVLETGAQMPAGALHPGVRLADGGRVEEIMLARVRRVCRLNGEVFGSMNRVVTPGGPMPISGMTEVIEAEGAGTDMVFLVTERSRVRSGDLLFEDMWGSAQMRQTRRISQAEVIAALNATEAT
jgi:hypothetical protein